MPTRPRPSRYLPLVSVTAANVFAVLFLCHLGLLGVRGELTDTSARTNLLQGVGLFAAAGVAALWTFGCFVVLRPKHDRKPHACEQCGYDCRATPERCPECGTAALPTAMPKP